MDMTGAPGLVGVSIRLALLGLVRQDLVRRSRPEHSRKIMAWNLAKKPTSQREPSLHPTTLAASSGSAAAAFCARYISHVRCRPGGEQTS
jgi:hypothetical protein